MYEKMLKLKQDKKWLYYLLFLPIAVLAILELYNKYLSNSVKKHIRKAEEKDKTLEKQQIKAEAGADFHKQEADKIKKDIKNTKITEDWHLND
jgi:G:T/U-mismatch repair DNA glycosylase